MNFIKKIDFLDTISIRHSVLRHGKPIETCYFDGDDANSTFHFGGFVDKKIVAVVSVFRNNNTTFNQEFQFQIRGMAVLEKYQKLSLGKQLFIACEKEIKLLQGELIWFNARQNAVGFYKKMGYNTVGEAFEIKEIGTHYLMHKICG